MTNQEDPNKLLMCNRYKPAIRVVHAALQRTDEHTYYKSVCPVCGQGTLLFARDQKTFDLLPDDRCVLCAQHFVYTDIDRLRAAEKGDQDGDQTSRTVDQTAPVDS